MTISEENRKVLEEEVKTLEGKIQDLKTQIAHLTFQVYPRHIVHNGSQVYIQYVPGKGRGVFANQEFKKGDLIETSPILVYSRLDNEVEPQIIRDVVFNYSTYTGSERNETALVLGLGSIFNSANPSNLRYEVDTENMFFRFFAVQDIPLHSELTINYSGGGSHISSTNTWFEQRNLKML